VQPIKELAGRCAGRAAHKLGNKLMNILVIGDWYSDEVGQKLEVFVTATVQLLPVHPGKHSTAPVT